MNWLLDEEDRFRTLEERKEHTSAFVFTYPSVLATCAEDPPLAAPATSLRR